MSIQTVKQLCRVSDLVGADTLAAQIANLEDLNKGGIDPDAFFRRNHFTEGLTTLVRNGFDRLSGRSDVGAFYLSQSMGGGKTHSLIAFALLAQDDGLRHRIVPSFAETASFGSAKVVVFNGHQNPDHFLWGEIAEHVGRPEAMTRFWKDGAKVPGIDDWVKTLGDEPILILLDELPSYLQMAEGHTVGNTNLAELTIGALERLFNALNQLPRACVVVTNLLDDVFAEGSTKLKTLINTLNKQYGKYAQAITPVQQNSGEVFQIIRKKLFDELPPDDVIEDIAQAYVDELNRAKRVDDIPVVPESYIQRIRETYPFHPSIRDIAARFKENAGYQQTRALIRILRLAVRNAWASDDQVFLIGFQHLDFGSQAVVEEVRKINAHFTNAISKDIADRGNAVAEQVDVASGGSLATSVSKLVLMSSLSTADQPILGLRRNELVEFLLDPLTKTPAIGDAIEKLKGRAEYLFEGPDQRIFFGQTANVTSEINNTAASLAEEVVDQTLREKLAEVFNPKTKSLYRRMFILPSLDEIEVGEDEVTLIVVERGVHNLPRELTEWWQNLERQNRVLILTADLKAMGSLRSVARQMRAIELVERSVVQSHGRESTQAKDVEKIKDRAAHNFTSAVRETFSSLVFPTESQLREYSQFRMTFDNNDYRGEEQILSTLEERGKYYPLDKVEKSVDALRKDAEEELFDADAVPRSELKRKAAAKAGWYWMANGGLEHLIDESIRTKHWREHQGLIEKKYTRETSVTVRLDGPIEPMVANGRYDLVVVPEDADRVHFSEAGEPDPKNSALVAGRSHKTSAPAVWFLAVDSKGEAKTGPVLKWEAPIKMEVSTHSTSEGTRAEWLVLPRSAEVRVSVDGSDPRQAEAAKAPFLIPPGTPLVRMIPAIDGRFGPETRLENGEKGHPERKKLRDDLPVTVEDPLSFESITRLTDALAALKGSEGAAVLGGNIEFGSDDGEVFVDATLGDRVRMAPTSIERVIQELSKAGGFEATRAHARFSRTYFATGKDYKGFADRMGLDFEQIAWSQSSDEPAH